PSGSLIERIKVELEKKKRPRLIAAFDEAARVELAGDELSIEFNPAAKHSQETLTKPENVRTLQAACAEVCGREIGIRFTINDDESDESAPVSPEEEARQAKQQARQAAAQNPTVQQVLRAFGAEIVDITMQ